MLSTFSLHKPVDPLRESVKRQSVSVCTNIGSQTRHTFIRTAEKDFPPPRQQRLHENQLGKHIHKGERNHPWHQPGLPHPNPQPTTCSGPKLARKAVARFPNMRSNFPVPSRLREKSTARTVCNPESNEQASRTSAASKTARTRCRTQGNHREWQHNQLVIEFKPTH